MPVPVTAWARQTGKTAYRFRKTAPVKPGAGPTCAGVRWRVTLRGRDEHRELAPRVVDKCLLLVLVHECLCAGLAVARATAAACRVSDADVKGAGWGPVDADRPFPNRLGALRETRRQ